ncbi:unnamed protein product [Rotaria sp. Silwood2]|nr:unnamed protein product [Rotaria sp. Silwood2]CAF2587055.1 unnamed protein product [Rotaria sp. Silwood2]CAF3861250.1 unnamed protein product [Rotaria sp. Silwood2]CAF3881940.1 unnamed protein product [Rotaria sp. Silwood2]
MLTASQDIDSFIERQRSQLNKQPSRQPVNRQPPPPPQPSIPPNNVQDRLDFKVARILDEPPPRIQSQQPYYPPPPPAPSYSHNSIPEQQENFYSQQRRLSNDNSDDNPVAFFNKFGTYDDKRSQLKDDLKREYNEYLQSKKNIPKSKSTSQLTSTNQNTNKRVQFQPPQQQQHQQRQQNGKVIAPWEKNDNKTIRNNQTINDLPLGLSSNDNITSRSRPQMSHNNYDEQYIRDREDYISELHSQVRELELRRKQLEIESSRLSAGGTSNVTRAHYHEDLNALNSLLAERLDQRNAVDVELAHILNRPPVSASPTRINSNGIPNLNMSTEHSQQISSQKYPQQNGRHIQSYRNDNRTRPNENGFQIGHETDKDSEQAAKKRYQQELQAQMREAQMRKAQDKRAKDEYDRKLEEDIQRYNYFGRSGGGAPMRDKDGNVIANLADVRNPPPPPPAPYQQQQQQQQQQHQQYLPPDNKVYSLGDGMSSIGNAPFYNGEQQQYSGNSDRPGSPNHARGAVSNGIFGAAKTEAQVLREEKYKQELKQQIDEKRQRELDEIAKRRAEEERELSKHLEWQQQMEKQTAEEALRKQEKEQQERQHQQQLHEELERQKKQEEIVMKRKPKRQEKPMTPKRDETHFDDNNDDTNANRQNSFNNQQPHQQEQSEPVYRSSSPPVPTLNNKGKKQKSTVKNVRRQQSYDEIVQQQSPPPPLPPLNNNDEFIQSPPIDDTDEQSRQTYRKPPTPRQPDVSSARKKPPQTFRSRPRANSNSGMPMRTNSTTSLRSDGSDSEVLNRLEHLKRQLKDKEARLQEHVNHHQGQPNSSSNTNEYSKTTYQPPTQRKQSPQFLFNAARVHHHRDSPTANDRTRRIIQTDDDMEFKPGYFRDDAILMGGSNENLRQNDNDYYSSSKRINSGNRIFTTNIEKEASRRRYGHDPTGFYDQDDPTTMANFELNRIAEQNEARLKKLRDLENDDASLLDSNEVLERFQQKQRMQRGGSQTTLQDDAWLK